MSKNHYGPVAFGDPRIANAIVPEISDAFPVIEQSGILLYAEFHDEVTATTPVPTTAPPTTVAPTTVDLAASAVVVRPWVKTKAKDLDGVAAEAWMPLPEVTLTPIAPTANQPPPIISGATRSVATMVNIPNAIEAKLELITDPGSAVTIWGAAVERAPA